MATQFITPSPAFQKFEAREETPGMLQTLGFVAFAVYFFLIFSRMPEITAMRFGTSFYQIFIFSNLCLVFTVISGGLGRVIGTRVSLILLGLHFWYMASLPFSYWKTGTVEHLSYIARYLPLAFFIMALVRNEKQLRTTFTVMRAAMLITLVFTLSAPVTETSDERLMIDGGRFSNSNEIAMYLLIGLPFWLHMAASSTFPSVLRVLAGVEVALSLYQCLRTGSRGGLITIVILGVIIFLASSAINKLKVIVLTATVAVLLIPLLPTAVRTRLLTLTGETRDESASGSSESRFALLMESIGIAARHPIVGVGVGVYAEAAAEISGREGRRKLWQVTHNGYTQVAAEAGLPAFALFMATLVISLKSLMKSRVLASRFPETQDLALMAGCLQLTTIVYLVSACFANIAQELFYYMVVGIAFACSWVVQNRYNLLVASETENTRRQAEAATLVPASQPQLNQTPSSSTSATKPAPAAPVVGRPKPIAPESQYGDVPWARNPARRQT
jgi:O-antigen ligase